MWKAGGVSSRRREVIPASGSSAARDYLAVALDVATLAEARSLLSQLSPQVKWFKVGAELYTAVGPAAVEEVVARGACAFLDLKIQDIPNTAARAVAAAVQLGANMLTLHTAGGRDMLRAARAAAEESAVALGKPRPLLVGVTVLTSLGEVGLREIGVARPLREQVLRLAELAREEGLDGVVASAEEASELRQRMSPDFWIVTPGVRPAAAAREDQQRVATPADAIRNGSRLIVIGRPILRAADPRAAAQSVLREIEGALVRVENE